MSAKFSALLVLIILEKAGSSARPVVTFHPNWDKIFTKESVTMTCNVGSPIPADMTFTWYKDSKPIRSGQSFAITNAKTDNSGTYKCEGTNTDISDPVRLDVHDDYVILQAPLYVHEGDDVTLRCHHYPGFAGRKTRFYKNGDIIRNWDSDPELQIKDINLGGSHRYKCSKEVYHNLFHYKHNGEASISVKELFTTPEIKVTPFPVIEGDNVTATCHTSVSPYRPETELQFAFYKDGWNVQSFNSSDQYGFQSTQLKNSGKYYCQVKKVSSTKIGKRSNEVIITLNVLFTTPELKVTPFPVTEEDNVTVTCHTRVSPYRPMTRLQFAFYKDGENVQWFNSSNQYDFQSTQLQNTGKYYCEVKTVFDTKIVKKSKEISIEINMSFTHPEITVVPNQIEEGDVMILICHTRSSHLIPEKALKFAFYRDGKNIQEFNVSDQYDVESAQPKLSGNYSCEVRASTSTLTKSSDELYIQIRELFSQPKIEMIPDVVIEGSQMLLTCNTSVMRNDAELQYAFYKNEENIQDFNSSHEYEALSAQLEDSGNYFCEVRSSINSVIKKSERLNVNIQGIGNSELLTILPLTFGLLLFLVAILVILFICRKRRSSVTTQELTTEEPLASTDSNVQPGIVYSILSMSPISQSDPVETSENHENNVVYAVVIPRSKRKPAAEPDRIYQNLSS